MRIVVPYTRLRDETVDAIAQHADGHDLHFVDVSGHAEQLWETWQWLWSRPEDTVVIEHDIVIHRDVLPTFEDCPSTWCSFGYEYAHFGVYHGTGCVRFRADLMRALPDLWERVARLEGPAHPPKHWCSLDAYAQLELTAAGDQQCRHQPDVVHLDSSNTHGCVPA